MSMNRKKNVKIGMAPLPWRMDFRGMLIGGTGNDAEPSLIHVPKRKAEREDSPASGSWENLGGPLSPCDSSRRDFIFQRLNSPSWHSMFSPDIWRLISFHAGRDYLYASTLGPDSTLQAVRDSLHAPVTSDYVRKTYAKRPGKAGPKGRRWRCRLKFGMSSSG